MSQLMEINMNGIKETGYVSTLFPDNQPHIRLTSPTRAENSRNNYIVTCSITSANKLLQLQMMADSIDSCFGIKETLIIPYLMGARFDRVMNPGDSFDLRVIGNIINSLSFQRVLLLDPHSDVAGALIHRSEIIDNQALVNQYNHPESLLIIPDAGAAKKAGKYFEWNKNITDSVQCIKHRDLTNGKIELKVLEPEKCKDKNCVIIDDLCDGGGTFLAIASQIEPKRLTLIVTHGIFSQGFGKLEVYFDKIITSNSYAQAYNSNIVQIIKYT